MFECKTLYMGQLYHKTGAFALFGVYGNVSAMQMNNFLCQGHTYAVAFNRCCLGVAPIEGCKEVLFVFRCHTYALILAYMKLYFFFLSYLVYHGLAKKR